MLEFPGVGDCAVVGVYTEELATEVPRAYVVVADAARPVDAERIAALV